MDSYTQIKQELQDVKNKISTIENKLVETPKIDKIEFRNDEICFSYKYGKKSIDLCKASDTLIRDTTSQQNYNNQLNIVAYQGSTSAYWLMYITNYLVRDLGYELKLTSCLNSFDFKKSVV